VGQVAAEALGPVSVEQGYTDVLLVVSLDGAS
jgi:hypothetical protein